MGKKLRILLEKYIILKNPPKLLDNQKEMHNQSQLQGKIL
jgi:hypothetical protein